MRIPAKNPEEYLSSVPPERRPHLEALRALVRREVPEATEGIHWGMLGWAVGGRCFAALASQKSYLSLYLMDLYAQPGLRERHEAALRGLQVGKSCINFHRVEELPLEAVAAILRGAPLAVVPDGTLAAGARRNAAPKAPRAAKPPQRRTPPGKPPGRRPGAGLAKRRH